VEIFYHTSQSRISILLYILCRTWTRSWSEGIDPSFRAGGRNPDTPLHI